ncbi:restriction endonuclease subunit S [Candidatus Poriferisodalis sp.]|uniref:restriction endonuclease subunit S n=1 Tax=Candidatus Poriferisodalis sp. TaxID=3101277 RepID=UPI003D0D514E
MSTVGVPLGELMLAKGRSIDPRKHPNEKFELFSIPAFDAGAPEIVCGSQVGSSKQVLERHDVLLSKIVPHIRRSWVVEPKSECRAVGSSEWIVFRSEHFEPKYLRHVLTSDRFHQEFMRTVAGVGGSLLRARPAYVAEIEIPLPPIDEQRRIAAVLDAAEALWAKRSEALAKLETLIQAVFVDLFGDSRQPSAKTVPLADLAEIVMGQSPPGDTYNESGIGVPLLNGPSEFGDKHPVPVQWTTSPTRMSREGDILFCVRGATAGRLNWADADYCLGRGLAAIRAEPSHRAFLFRVLDAHYVRFQSSGVGSTFINIGKSDLHGVPVPMASTSAVLEYARIYSALSEQRTALNVSLAKIDELYLSLQQRAFRGEL